MSIPATEATQFRGRTFWLLYWLPALIWLGVIAMFSTRVFGAGHTGSILRWVLDTLHIHVSQHTFDTLHFLWRKSAHFLAYAILSILMFRALRGTDLKRLEWKLQYLVISLVVCVLTAIIDETHQYFTPGRTGNPNDVVLDSVAALFVQFVILFWIQLRLGRINNRITADKAARPADR